MVDTIVLRVHNLRKHAQLVKIINRDFKSKGELMSMTVNKNELENYSEAFKANDKLMIDYFRVEGIGTHRLRYKNLKKLNNSGHYYLNAFINKERDFIELNFSVPKYFYGTNVMQFVEHPWERSFIYHQNGTFSYNMSSTHSRLMKFIGYFFQNEFPEEPVIDFTQVEVNRIDLCFNQIFHTKQLALEYLEFQKSLQRKHTRANSEKYREYESSFMYVTDRYSIKVYHKGYEYAKNDIKEHQKINETHHKQLFNIQELQNFSDRMLRYEVTFRKSMLSYLYNQNIFRQQCPVHQDFLKTYKKVEKCNLHNERIAEKISRLKTEKAKDRYLEKFPYIRVNLQEKRIHKHISKLLGKSKTFMLRIDKEVNLYNHVSGDYGYFEPRALFSRKLLDLCGKFFCDFIKEFQVKERPSVNTVAELIDTYNNVNYEKLPKNEMLKFFLLLQDKTFDDIKKSGVYSKASFYRYKQRFKKIGITQSNVVPTSLVEADTDFRNYHSHLMYNKRLVNRLR